MKRLFSFLALTASAWAQISSFPPSGGSLGGDVTGPIGANTVVKINNQSVPISAGALGTDANGALISVTPSGTTPGYPANQAVSGLGVEYVSGLTFTVGAGTYTIGGTQYTIATLTTVTLATADPSNPRIDVIYVDNTGTASKITGTPAATPAQPTVDYSTQLPLNIILVPAGATTPGGVATTLIYDENTEWTSTCSTHVNCASTNNPYSGTKDIEATAAVLGNSVTLVKPAAGTVNLSTQNTLVFYIRSKAAWPSANNTGGNGLRTLSLFWLNGSTQVGLQVVLKDGAFGFSSSNTTTYQQIAIPVSLFGTGSNLVTTLKAQVTGNGGTSSFGWYIDEVTLQSGQAPISLPATLMNFKGTWNSTANYNVNDLVVSSGIYYTALAANTNVAVSTAATWAAGFPSAIPSATTATTQSANDNSTKIATTAYVDRPVSFATPGNSHTFAGRADIFVCTTTCTITVPLPAAGVQYCVMNDDNVSTAITLSAIGSSGQYENQARTAYGTATTGTLVSAGAVKDQVCILGRDSTHYLFASGTGTWTAN